MPETDLRAKLAWDIDQQSQQATVGSIDNVRSHVGALSKDARAAALSFKDIDTAAKTLGLSRERMAELADETERFKRASLDAGKTTLVDPGQASLGFTRELEQIQAREVAHQQEITKQLAAQQAITERLAVAEKARANAESGLVGDLRKDAFGDVSVSTGASSGGRTLGQNISNVGRIIFNAPAVGASTPIARGLMGAGAGIDALGLSLGQVALGAGITTAALIAIVKLGLEPFNKIIEDGKAKLTGALGAQKSFYDAVANSTSEQVREQVDNLNRVLDSQRQQIVETQNALDSAFAQAQANFGDALARSLDAAGKLPTTQLREGLEELKKNYEETEQTVVRLSQGLGAGVFAANDMREAEKRLAEAREESAHIIDARQTQIALNAANNAVEAQRLTAEERRQAVDSISEEITVLEHYRDTHKLTEDAARNLAVRLDDLRDRQITLSETTLSYSDVLSQLTDQENARIAALSSQTDALLTVQTNEVKAREDLFRVQTELTESTAEQAEKRADTVREDEARRNQIVGDATERREEIEQEGADRRDEILRDFNRDYTTAIGDRDALAATKDKQRRDDDLIKQAKTLEKQEAQLEKSTGKQLGNQRIALAKQLEQFDRSNVKRLRTQQQALNRAHADLANALHAQRVISTDAQQQRIIQEFNHQNAMITITQNGANGIRAAWSNMMLGIQQEMLAIAARQIVGGVFGTGGGGNSPFGQAVNRAVDQRMTFQFNRMAGR